MEKILKIFVIVCALNVFSLPAFSSDTIRIALPSWVEAQAIAHLLGEIITSRLGLKVEYVASDNETIFKAMHEGKGKIDIHPDVWLPNQKGLVKKYVDEAGTVTLSSNPYVGEVGFCVIEDFAKDYNVNSIVDLRRPDVMHLLDSDGDGKGEIWIGGEDWASSNVNEIKIRDYRLLEFFNPVRGNESFRDENIRDSIAKKTGHVFYCYSPDSMWLMFDLVMLKEPEYHPIIHRMVQPSDDPDWYNKSRVMSKDSLKKMHIAWSKSLNQRAPEVIKFLSNFSIKNSDVTSITYEIIGKGRSFDDVVKDWVWKNSVKINNLLIGK